MLKPGLGKGLGDLMQGDQVAGTKPVSNEAPAAPNGFGRGLKTLMDAEAPTVPKPEARPLLPVWFFFAADLLLLAYTIAITFEAPRPFDMGTVLFCAISISLGAFLATVGVFRSRWIQLPPGSDRDHRGGV